MSVEESKAEDKSMTMSLEQENNIQTQLTSRCFGKGRISLSIMHQASKLSCWQGPEMTSMPTFDEKDNLI